MRHRRVNEDGQQRLATDERLHRDRQAGTDDRRRWCGRGIVDDVDRGDELVPPPVHGADDRLTAAVVAHRLAQRLDARGQRRLAHEAVTPDRVEQLLLAHQRAAVECEIRQHVEHLRLDRHLDAVASQNHPSQVQLTTGEPKNHALGSVW